MIGVALCCVGSLGEKFYADACAEYQKRLSAYCALSVREYPEARLSKNPFPAEIAAALKAEGARIKLEPRDTVVALCVEGRELSSEQLAAQLSGWSTAGRSRIAFVVGGSYGLCDEIKARADLKLSLSRMTLPHHLARVVLLEQLYRAFSINAGAKYHK